ncbi:effector-associated constant component EACC1 [Actinomadura macrotermitis]|uniref:effector-associated constant component EACC1 n=1 Tax=Actinomadura macrotermitis TaxID=2585200 RepID=UPI001294E80D|nr:hypothetical protein [Actinomadura macrotermitis]
MNVRLEVDGPSVPDLLRDLASWLDREPGLVGRVDLIEKGPEPGQLGPMLEALQFTVTALSSAIGASSLIVNWLQFRKPDVTIRVFIDREGQVLSATAEKAKSDAGELEQRLAQELSKAVEQETEGDSGEGPTSL